VVGSDLDLVDVTIANVATPKIQSDFGSGYEAILSGFSELNRKKFIGDNSVVDEDLNKVVVRWFIEGFLNTGDADLADEVLAADYIDHTPSNPELAGRENIKRFVNKWLAAFPDSHIVLKDMAAEGDRVSCRWITTSTHQGQFGAVNPIGARVEVEAIGIFRIADSRVVEIWDKCDTKGHPWRGSSFGPSFAKPPGMYGKATR
jgi:predicted ester cyclase